MQHSQYQSKMTRISIKFVLWIDLGILLKKKPKKCQYSDVAAICYNMQQICSKYVALLKKYIWLASETVFKPDYQI